MKRLDSRLPYEDNPPADVTKFNFLKYVTEFRLGGGAQIILSYMYIFRLFPFSFVYPKSIILMTLCYDIYCGNIRTVNALDAIEIVGWKN